MRTWGRKTLAKKFGCSLTGVVADSDYAMTLFCSRCWRSWRSSTASRIVSCNVHFSLLYGTIHKLSQHIYVYICNTNTLLHGYRTVSVDIDIQVFDAVHAFNNRTDRSDEDWLRTLSLSLSLSLSCTWCSACLFVNLFVLFLITIVFLFTVTSVVVVVVSIIVIFIFSVMFIKVVCIKYTRINSDLFFLS